MHRSARALPHPPAAHRARLRRLRARLGAALASLGLALAVLCAGAAPRARADEEKLLLNFRDAQPAAIIEAVARATGTRIVMEPGLRGQLTIALEDKVSPAEAFEILNAALLTIGFAPVPAPSGGYVILPIEVAKNSAPWIHHSVSEGSERMVTTLVRLSAANAQDLAHMLMPADRSSLVIAYPPTNSLIIAAAEDRIAYLLDLLRALDQAAASQLEVLPLRWADAKQVATQLATIFKPDVDTRPELPLKVNVDPRTNSLIVAGAPKRIADVRKYVALVDVPARTKGKVHVVRVFNAVATELAQQLSSISLDERAGPGAFAGLLPGAAPMPGTGGRPAGALAKLPGKSFTVVADDPTNSLLIVADPATFALLAEVIAELDHIPARIAIEVSVWTVETTHALDLGFDALLPLIIPNDANDVVAFAAFGNPAPLIAGEALQAQTFVARFMRSPILIPVIGPDGNPTTIVAPGGGAQITASAGDLTVRTLASPYLLAASGEEQHIFAGQNVPIPVSGSGTSSTTGGTTTGTTSTTTPGSVSSAFTISTNITRQDVGIDLRVKPVSLSEHLSLVEIAIEISDVSPTVVTTATTADAGPTLDQFKLQATVRLNDGAVVLIGSAPKDTTETIVNTVPFLGKIPILGWLFKSTSDRVVRRRMIATVQATQIHSPSEERAEQTERVLAFQRRNARIQPLRALVSEPYALLVATRDSREAAAELLPEIADLPGDPLVVEWHDDAEAALRYDVYLAGFRDIASLGNEAVKLRERGFTPRLEVAGDPQP
jgi:general secretion pathway protein D